MNTSERKTEKLSADTRIRTTTELTLYAMRWNEFGGFRGKLFIGNTFQRLGVDLMPTADELDTITNEQLEREKTKQAILSLEIQQMKEAIKKTKAVGNDENVSGL